MMIQTDSNSTAIPAAGTSSTADGSVNSDPMASMGRLSADFDKSVSVSELAAKAIEKRADERMLGVNGMTDDQLAKADVTDFKKIAVSHWQESAAVQMSMNMDKYPDYLVAIRDLDASVIDRVRAAELRESIKISEKEQRKGDDIKELLRSSVDLSAFTDLTKKREAEFTEVREALGLNAIERVVENSVKPNEQPRTNQHANAGANEVESDEIFTASSSNEKSETAIPSDVQRRFVRVGNKYYYAANTEKIAFEDKGNSLTTESNGEGMAASLVAIANARGWDEIKVSGSEVFKREVWLEAASKGMHVKGYKPNEFDLETLAKRVPEGKVEKVTEDFRGREKNSLEKNKPQQTDETIDPNKKLAKVFELNAPVDAAKKHPELAGAAALTTAVFERHVSHLNENEKKVVLDQVKKNVVNNIGNGKIPDIQVAEKNQTESRNHRSENEKDLSL